MTSRRTRIASPVPNPAAFIEREKTFGARNYDPLPVVLAHGEGAWVTDVGGRRLSRSHECLFRGELRPCAPADPEGARRAGARARGDVARIPQRQAAVAPGTDHAAYRTCARVAVQWRCGSGGNGVEGDAQMGLPGQGHCRRPRRDHRLREQLSWPLDHDRRLLVGAAVPRRLRAVRPRLQGDSVRRRGGAGGGDHARYRGIPGRADPGRGRHRRSAGGLSRRLRAHLPRSSAFS